MQDEEQNANQDDNQVQPNVLQEEEQAVTEEAAPEQPEDTSVSEAESEQSSEDIDINQYWQERYQAPQQADNRGMVDEVAKELAALPTDEYGTVDSTAAAEWFANRLSQAEGRAAERAIQAAEQVVMGNLSEANEQRKLIDKYPEIQKDRGLMEDIFDKRDAAALRGQNMSLLQAAERVMGRTSQARTEGAQAATRRTSIQAAAHLETATNKGGTRPVSVDFSSKEARQAALKQFVQNGIESGEIQVPGR